MTNLDLSPLILSLKTGAITTFIAFFLGIFLAKKVMNLPAKRKIILDSILTLPMVLPPTVAGFILLITFSLRRPFGSFLKDVFHIQVVQHFLGCVLASLVISLPLMYKSAKSAFEQLDSDIINAARTLGMSESSIFWKIMIPLARPGLLSGAILTFARAMGEYGATMMLAGNIAGKTRTISMAISSEVAVGNYQLAGYWVIMAIVLSLIIVTGIQLFIRREGKNDSH